MGLLTDGNSARDSQRSMKKLLSTMPLNFDPNSQIEFKKRTHNLCARYLGGIWKTVSVAEITIKKLSGGLSNMLFLCCLVEDHRPIEGEEPDKSSCVVNDKTT
ncbi:hypothetical protein niasHT_027538 [Heterodera trifolii]|uniref:Uncharacterized protein n=1 Tax=Heterodera trifolii TaxID=157864 RepID=A0ABD2K598_9BILA